MKKLFLIIIGLLLCASPCFGASWYAQGAGNMSAVTWNSASGGGGSNLTWNSQANGDIFESNNYAITVDVDPRGTTLSGTDKVQLKTTGGGGFSVATSTSPITIHADIVAGTTDCLTVSGNANASPALTIVGNITGGAASGIEGVVDTHTVGTVVVQGNITGGTVSTTAYGYNWNGATGSLSITGNVTASVANGLFFSGASTTGVTVTGNAIGSSTNGNSGVLSSYGSGPITIIGNIISGKGMGAAGYIIYTPAATNYVLFPKDSSYTRGTVDAHATEMPTNPGVKNVKAGTTYGSFTGTLSSSGGGAWAF